MADVIQVAKDSIAAYDDKDWDKAAALMADGIQYEEHGSGRKIEGKGQVIEAYQGWGSAIPDSKGEIVNAVASGNQAVLQIVWRGTHTGPLQAPTGTIEATGKSIEIPACMVVTVEDDKVTKSEHYFNLLSLLQQIGVA